MPPEPGGAGTRPQPPRAVPAPGHRQNHSRCLGHAQSLENPRVSRQPSYQPPPQPRGKARRAGSTPWGGAAQQMHTRSLSDLHMEWRHLSPSPTQAPTRHVAWELPAPPPPQFPGSTAHSQALTATAATTAAAQCRGGAGEAWALSCHPSSGNGEVSLRSDGDSHGPGPALFPCHCPVVSAPTWNPPGSGP